MMTEEFDIVSVVQLVSGERKYGLLLKRNSVSQNPHWEFVSFGNLKTYVRSKDKTLIERVPLSIIKFIDRVHV